MSDSSTTKPRWSQKRRRRELAAAARASKQLRLQNEELREPLESDVVDGPITLDASLILPRVAIESEEEGMVTDLPTFSEDDAMVVYKEWIGCQTKATTKMISIMFMDIFRGRFALTDVAAAKEVALVVDANEKTIRTWRNDFYENGGDFTESGQGKHNRPYVLDDENCKKTALSWLRENAYQKDKPNLTAATFASWVNNSLLPNSHLSPGFPRTITPRTARRWLHDLGFSPTLYRKGLYFDGHERADVVEYRRIYLRKLEVLQISHIPPPSCSGGHTEEAIGSSTAQKRLVLLYHDESCFHANEGQQWQWTEVDKLALRPKSQGRGLMVSDFIDEHCGFLRLSAEEYEITKLAKPDLPAAARVLFKFGAQGDGYWNSEHFIAQVKVALKIAEFKYPSSDNDLVFLFDQSSGHCAYAEDALIAHKMNVSNGGKQPFMKETIWDARPQKMVTSTGLQKGLKSVLEERGVNVKGMKKEDMVKVLEEMRDFKFQKTKVEELILNKGHRVMFIPKFHCEINPIERVWCHGKKYTRANCDYTFAGLEKTINTALDSVSVELIRKFFRKSREYRRAYREGKQIGEEMKSTLKLYKSHRRVPESTNDL